MEPPFLVLREGKAVTSIPIAEFFDMQEVARALVARHLAGDVTAARQIAQVYELAAGRGTLTDDERRRAIVSTYVLVRAREEAERHLRRPPPSPAPQGDVGAEHPPPPPAAPVPGKRSWCGHGIPHTDSCQACGRDVAPVVEVPS